jgi:hypothetical protein
MAIQWHPLFVQLLRPLVERYYDLQTNVPVGDMPRAADLLLLRRTTNETQPFRSLWRHLTKLNVLEYKGPTVAARLEHLDLLVELGLGIHRRLNEEEHKKKQKFARAADVSFWYLVHEMSGRFRSEAARKLRTLEPLDEGIWHSAILDHPFFLVNGSALPVQEECAPFHVLNVSNADKGLAVTRLMLDQPPLWDLCAQVLANLHPETLKELATMARKTKEPKLHIKEYAEFLGMKNVIDELGLRRIIDVVGAKKVIDEMFGHLPAARRAELVREIEQAKGHKS